VRHEQDLAILDHGYTHPNADAGRPLALALSHPATP